MLIMTAHAGATFMTLADTPERFNKTQCGLIVNVSILSAVELNSNTTETEFSI